MVESVAAAETERIAEVLRVADERERLRQAHQDAPTTENYVLFAFHVWRQDCTVGAAGECEECNKLFLGALAKHLRGETP